MALADRVKRGALSVTARQLLRVVANASDKNLMRLVKLLQPLVPNTEFYHSGLAAVRRMLEEEHEGINAVRRVLKEPSKQAVGALVDNMILGSIVGGYKKRYAFWDKHDLAPPAAILISPSMRCNLKCRGCYADDYERDVELTPETVNRLIAEAREIGICSFTFLGGEPFMWPHLLDVIEANPEVAFQVFTNGTLLDDEKIKRLAAAGNVLPCLGIEGWRETTEKRRGPNSFDRTLDLMDRMRAERMLIAYSITTTQQNLDEVTDPEFIGMMVEHGAHLGWYFHYQPTGRCPELDSLPTPEQRVLMGRRLRQARRDFPILIVDFMNDGILTAGCMSAGRRYLHINHRGDVEPCIFVHFATDNIHEKSLAEAICSDFFRDLRKHMPFNPNHLRPCMILDHPDYLREAVKTHNACPTHPEASALFDELAPSIDEYSANYAPLADEAWAESRPPKKQL